MIDENLIDRVYDALPKMPRSNEPYYSRSAIRLILNAGYGISLGDIADGGPCPIPPPSNWDAAAWRTAHQVSLTSATDLVGICTAAASCVASATRTTISSRSAICSATESASNSVDNTGTLDIRAIDPGFEHLDPCDPGETQPKPRARDNHDEIIFREASRGGMGHERPSSISEPRDVRARMRDELEKIVVDAQPIAGVPAEMVDRILNALRNPRLLFQSETFRFGEYSRRNIEAFIDDVRGRAI